jgi:glycosyltransferase involved in cell wall biosynthesis
MSKFSELFPPFLGYQKYPLWYVYPLHHVVSFTLVGKRHIEQLKKRYKVEEVGEVSVFDIYPYSKPVVIIHPLIYAAGDKLEKLVYFSSMCQSVLGVEVADSDMISNQAVAVANSVNAIILPSKFAEEAYRRSGVVVPIHIVPHGVPSEFLRGKREPADGNLKLLKKLKDEKKYVYLLYFLWHSGFRKGADLVKKAVDEIQKSRDNVVLVMVSFFNNPSINIVFQENKVVNITGFLEDPNKVDLYDICDIYLLFSRGGGFEINGLEALSRGEIVIAPDAGAWTEYLPSEFLVKTAKWVRVFFDNPYHIGNGPEIDVDKAVDKILFIIDNLDSWKEKAESYAKTIRQQYSWDSVGEKLIKVVSQYVE